MVGLTGGRSIGCLIMGMVNPIWWLPAAVVLTMACSFWVQASAGSTVALVPQVKRRITGQIAGNVGAYGNVGAVAYLTIWLLLVDASEAASGDGVANLALVNAQFFQVLGIVGLKCGLPLDFLPRGASRFLCRIP